MNSKKEEQILTQKFKLAVGLIAIVFVVYGVVVYNYRNDVWEKKGQFGDTFGALNALFSGLAFAVLIYTALMQRIELRLQRKELRLQREEMKLNRVELEKQANAQKSTEVILQTQLTESTFFNLLKNHKEVVLAGSSEFFSSKMADVITEVNEYAAYIRDSSFPSCGSTHKSPSAIFLRNHLLMDIGRNIHHIAQFIEEKIPHNSRDFYHSTLYNSFSTGEKYLYGMVKANLLLKEVDKIIYNYSDYYFETTRYSERKGYFIPEIYFEVGIVIEYSPIFDSSEAMQKIFESSIMYLNCPVKFLGFSYTYFVIGTSERSSIKFAKTTGHINYGFLFADEGLVSKIIPDMQEVMIKLNLVVETEGNAYTIECQSIKVSVQTLNRRDSNSNEGETERFNYFKTDKLFCIRILPQ